MYIHLTDSNKINFPITRDTRQFWSIKQLKEIDHSLLKASERDEEGLVFHFTIPFPHIWSIKKWLICVNDYKLLHRAPLLANAWSTTLKKRLKMASVLFSYLTRSEKTNKSSVTTFESGQFLESCISFCHTAQQDVMLKQKCDSKAL